MARAHALAFADVPGVRLVGIYSRTRLRAEEVAEQFGIAAVYNSIQELYEKAQADLVLVTVFEMSMLEVAIACLQYPWTIFLEKPPGMDLSQAEEIHAVAQKKRCKVLVGLNRRFLSSTRVALSDVEQYQSPRFIHVQDQQNLKEAESYGHPEAVIQNWMYANSIHLVDYLIAFGRGRVTKVTPIMDWDPNTSRVVLSKVDFESGDIGLYEGIWEGPGPWAVSVTVPEKRWEMRPLEQAIYQSRGERQRHDVERHRWDVDFKSGFRLQAEHVVNATQGESSDAVSMAEALETMKLIHAIFRE
jgi:predicted dehydrogenase